MTTTQVFEYRTKH